MSTAILQLLHHSFHFIDYDLANAVKLQLDWLVS